MTTTVSKPTAARVLEVSERTLRRDVQRVELGEPSRFGLRYSRDPAGRVRVDLADVRRKRAESLGF